MTRPDLMTFRPDQTFSDAAETISGSIMQDRVGVVRTKLQALGLATARLCLPLDSGLGSIALLLAGVQSGAQMALIAKPADTAPADWPAFCDAAIVPAPPGSPPESFNVIALTPDQPDAGHDQGAKVWLRSSGTTGTPKWILHRTDSLIRNALAAADRLQITAQDRVLIPVPLHHMFGLGAALLPSVLVGASLHVVARGNPLVIFQAQRSFQPSAVFMVPSQCRSMMALGRKAGAARMTVVAGDRLSPAEAALFEADHGPVINLYGSSELGVITCGIVSDPAELRHATAGPVMAGGMLSIDETALPDPQAEGAVPMRLVHPNGFEGYADAKTGVVKSPADSPLTTGDLVRLHPAPQGAANSAPRIEVLGRSDHAVNRDGLLVHLGQIEGCLATARGVALSAVVAAGQSRRGVGLVAFCTLTRPGAATPTDIFDHSRTVLLPRAVPDGLHLLDEMPLLPSGKVDRRRLTDLAKERLSSAGSIG